MVDNQQVLSESRTLMNRISNEHNVLKLKELIDELIEMYEIYPSLTEVLESLASKRVTDKKELLILEKKALKEIQKIYEKLTKICQNKAIAIPELISDAYDQKIISSLGYTNSRFVATCDLLFFLNNQVEISLIKKYAILNQAGNIYECIFLPSYTKWHQERELAKKSAWYSFDQIMYLKNTATLSFIEDYPLEDNQHNNGLLTFHAVMLRTDPQVVLMQYKECVKTLHDDTKSVLLSKQKQPDSYNQKTGILVRNRVKTTFNPTQLRGLVLSLMHPRGNPRTTALPFDEIYAKAIRSNTDKHWDDLDPASREKIKKQIFEAYEGINERVIKKANQPLLVAQGLTLHFA